MLEEVDAEVADEDEEERVRHVRALGQHAHEGRGEHEPRAAGHEVAERRASAAVRLRDDHGTGEISGRRDGREGQLC